MTKQPKPESSSSTISPNAGQTAAAAPSEAGIAPNAVPTASPETPPGGTTVGMRITRPPSDDVPPDGATDAESKPVVLHDLSGYVVFALPPRLKEVLGEAAFERCVSDLEAHEVTAIHREVDTIVYIRMHCVAQLFVMPKENPHHG